MPQILGLGSHPSAPPPPIVPQGPTVASLQRGAVPRSRNDAASRGLGEGGAFQPGDTTSAAPGFLPGIINQNAGIPSSPANDASALQALVDYLNQGGNV